MIYENHVISTNGEVLTSGFMIPSRPTHYGADYIDKQDLQITEKGVDIIAFTDGKVVEVLKGNLIGNTVALAHEGKFLTRYQHMRDGVSVKLGDTVKKGQKIGVMGNSGDCRSSRTDVPLKFRGTHLHFGIKINSTAYNNGDWVNPEPYLLGEKSFGGAPSVKPAPSVPAQSGSNIFVAGEKAKVKNGAPDFTGVRLASFVYQNIYDVLQIRGDGAVVIGIAGEVTAAMNAKDLEKV